jgi:filamentous hemagglutinin
MATQTGDITLTGANVVSEGNLAINAARDLTITSAQDTAQNANQSNNKAIGKVVISDTERFAGYHNEKHLDNSNQATQVASNVSSLTGNVALTAGDKYTQASSNVLAGNDVTITAKSLDITALDNTGSSQSANSDLKTGAFARVSSPLIDLVNNVEAARKSDGRLQAMQGLAAAANGYQAAQAVAGNGALIKGEVGIGFASSSDSSNSGGSTAVGSTINGGGNVTLTATEGDLHATGATLGAGKTLALDAAQNIVLDASQSTFHTYAKNRSAGAEVGVGYSVGAKTGVYAYAAVNAGKGHSNSDGTINNNTQLKADTITINSNGDTTLKGAVATANTINVDVGGKLAIESVQDTTRQESSQSNVGARVQVSFGTAWQASGNLSQQKGSSSLTAVGEQSGLFAGDGGYHVKADTVDLKGGAIASTNTTTSELTTNKLTATNLENKMDYSASNVSLAGGIGGKSELARNDNGTVKSLDQQKQLFGTAKDGNVTPGLPMMEKGSDSSTTYATVTDGKITIGGVTTGSVKDLGINTDASKAHTALDKLPDLQEVLKNQQAMSAAAGTVLATSKQIIGEIANNASNAAALEQSIAQKIIDDPASSGDQKAVAENVVAVAKETQADWSVGGIYSRALNAGVNILVGGLAGQSGGQIVSNAAGPTVAKTVGDIGSELAEKAAQEKKDFLKEAKDALLRNDLAAVAEYEAKAQEAATLAANWGENGVYRVGLHAATQGMLGSLANGQAGALQGAGGVVGGNLGQQFAASIGNADADKLGLTGAAREAFVNVYQNTGAVVGGMLAGAAAGNALGDSANVGTLLAAAQGGQAAETVDSFNRQLHYSTERPLIEKLARDKAKEVCGANIECQKKVYILFGDALERVAEGMVDKNEDEKNKAYLSSLAEVSKNPESEGSRGKLAQYGDLLNQARAILAPYVGTPIIVSGKPVVGPDGKRVTYFSATESQRADKHLYAWGSLPDSIVYGVEARDQERLENFAASNGATHKNYIVEELLLGERAFDKSILAVKKLWQGIDGLVPVVGDIETAALANIPANSVPPKGGTGGGAVLGDDSIFLMGEVPLLPAKGELTGVPELPPKGANKEMVRSINRQNEAGEILANHGLKIEFLPNTGRKGGNPDLSINGQLADVYSPSGNSVLTVRENVVEKVEHQAPNIVISLDDSKLSMSDVAHYLQRSPVPQLKSIFLIKDGKVVMIKGE